MQTQNGPDTATLRYRALSGSSVKIHVEEEKSRDGEVTHANENVGYMTLWQGCFARGQAPANEQFAAEGKLEFGDITLDHNL